MPNLTPADVAEGKRLLEEYQESVFSSDASKLGGGYRQRKDAWCDWLYAHGAIMLEALLAAAERDAKRGGEE